MDVKDNNIKDLDNRKSKWKHNDWCSSNPFVNCGEIRESNVVVNELPQIGEFVVVMDKYIYERSQIKKDRIVTAYKVSATYKDARGVPRVYEVVGYTKGIELPLDPENSIILKYSFGSGENKKEKELRIKTLLACTGPMLLKNVGKIHAVADIIGYSNTAIPADYSVKARRRKKKSEYVLKEPEKTGIKYAT